MHAESSPSAIRLFIHSSQKSVNGGQKVEEKGEAIVPQTDQLSWAFVSNLFKKKNPIGIVVSYTAMTPMCNNLSFSAAEEFAQNQGKAQLNWPNLKILSSFNWLWHKGQQLHFVKGQKRWANNLTGVKSNQGWVSVEAAKHRARPG